ncbi:MAG: energy transducer TonB, partial [Flavobacterium sp.]|uniref:energy transducer TonB n=1 Tax=Flavobacterium sp. TaxID=239 RepID=UPI00121246A9
PPPAFEIPRDTIKTATYYSETTFHIKNADGTTETKRFDELTRDQLKQLPPPPPKVAGDHSPYPTVLEWYFDAKGTRVLKTPTQPKIADTESSANDVEKASFPGGIAKFFDFYVQEFKMPAQARAAKAKGKIFLAFTVETDGSITNVKVLKGQSKYGLNDEAVRVMKSSPKWIPAKENGKVVRSEFSLPVSYR